MTCFASFHYKEVTSSFTIQSNCLSTLEKCSACFFVKVCLPTFKFLWKYKEQFCFLNIRQRDKVSLFIVTDFVPITQNYVSIEKESFLGKEWSQGFLRL